MEPGPCIGGYRAPNPCLSYDEFVRAGNEDSFRSPSWSSLGNGVACWTLSKHIVKSGNRTAYTSVAYRAFPLMLGQEQE